MEIEAVDPVLLTIAVEKTPLVLDAAGIPRADPLRVRKVEDEVRECEKGNPELPKMEPQLPLPPPRPSACVPYRKNGVLNTWLYVNS